MRLSPSRLQQARDLRLKPQGLDGKGRERGVDLAVRDDDERDARVAGERMRSAQGLGKGKPRGEAQARASRRRQVGKKRPLAAEEMRHAGDLEPEPVIAVGIERGAIAARCPAGEVEQRLSILLRRGGKGEKMRADGAGIGEAEAGIEALRVTLAALTAVRRSPRSSLPTRAKGRSSANGAAPFAALSRFSRSIGRCGRKTETKRLMTELHDKASPRCLAPAALEREVPGRRAWRRRVEGGRSAALLAAMRQRVRVPGSPAWRCSESSRHGVRVACAARLRRRAESGVLISISASAAISARLFSPSSSAQAASSRSPRLDDEKQRRVEAEGEEAGPIRAPPFPRGIRW